MANSYTLTSDWTTANRFDVTGDRDVLVSNTCAFDIRWARTSGPDTPATAPAMSHLLRPGQSMSLSLRSGQAIWLAALPGGTALVEDFG
ncbi:hypothetical protein [Marinibacterium sp. SX1]|uniref:hypothetical protein n=1 Tax=Marinibacterium sp. SX1 TaxID=3388424 RepID=UPI003D1707D9